MFSTGFTSLSVFHLSISPFTNMVVFAEFNPLMHVAKLAQS